MRLLLERTAFMKPAPFVLAIACAFAYACGESATAPSAAPGYDGQWSGTTSQGRPIAFTVSSNHVTAVTVGYSFASCSGSKTFSNVNVEIVDRSGPGPGGQPTPNISPGFAYGSGAPDGSSVQIQGFFRSNTTADGVVVFAEYPGCGDGFGFWTATKR
jgi:hypothetical protein